MLTASSSARPSPPLHPGEGLLLGTRLNITSPRKPSCGPAPPSPDLRSPSTRPRNGNDGGHSRAPSVGPAPPARFPPSLHTPRWGFSPEVQGRQFLQRPSPSPASTPARRRESGSVLSTMWESQCPLLPSPPQAPHPCLLVPDCHLLGERLQLGPRPQPIFLNSRAGQHGSQSPTPPHPSCRSRGEPTMPP